MSGNKRYVVLPGMTNRKDMIDEALLRPGHPEVQMEISLPDEAGRVQILNIHTSLIKTNNKLGADVDIGELAENTKNFSGAELAALTKATRGRKVWIGIKKLLSLVEMAKQTAESHRVEKFLTLLEEEQAIDPYL